MGEHEKVEVIEKHYHHGEKEKSGNGLAIAGLTTGTVGTAGVLALAGVELIKAISGRIANGGGVNPGAVVSSIASAVAPAIAAMSGPRYVSPSHCGGGGEVAALRAKVSRLEAEKYSDNAAKAESDRLLVNWLKPYGQEIADSRVREARMSEQIECLKKTQELEAKIAQKDLELAKQEAACCCKANSAAIAALEVRLDAVTKTVIPNEASCPGWGNVTITPETLATAFAAAMRSRSVGGQ